MHRTTEAWAGDACLLWFFEKEAFPQCSITFCKRRGESFLRDILAPYFINRRAPRAPLAVPPGLLVSIITGVGRTPARAFGKPALEEYTFSSLLPGRPAPYLGDGHTAEEATARCTACRRTSSSSSSAGTPSTRGTKAFFRISPPARVSYQTAAAA